MVRLGAGDGASERRGAVGMGEEGDSVVGKGRWVLESPAQRE